MFLKTHLSYIHRQLRYWSEIEKSDSVDQLQQHQQQQQLMSSECKNKLQTEIDIVFGMDMEQEIENFSWVRTDENLMLLFKKKTSVLLYVAQFLEVGSDVPQLAECVRLQSPIPKGYELLINSMANTS